jgi:hypothetical protein
MVYCSMGVNTPNILGWPQILRAFDPVKFKFFMLSIESLMLRIHGTLHYARIDSTTSRPLGSRDEYLYFFPGEDLPL